MWTRVWLFLSLVSVLVVPHCCFRADATIGVLFNEINWQSLLPLRNALKKQNMVDQALVRFSTDIQQVSATDSFNVSKTVCELIGKRNGVAAIISVQGSETSPIQESICFNSELPFISMSWGPTQVRDGRGRVRQGVEEGRQLQLLMECAYQGLKENNISMSLNFYPEARLFAKGLMEVVKALRWTSFVILYETEEGLIRMQEILKLQEFHRGKRNSILVKQLGPGPDYRMLLKEIRNASEYIILDCKTESIIPILLQAKDLRMLELHNNYFLTSLDAHTLDYSILQTTANITTIRLFDPNRQEFQNVLKRWLLSDNENENENIDLPPNAVLTETVLLYDAFTHVMECIKSLAATSSVETNPISCEEKSKSKNGFALYNFCRVAGDTIGDVSDRLQDANFQSMRSDAKKPERTLTGAVKFDEFGNRVHFKIDIVDVDTPSATLGSWHSHNESMLLYRGENETFDANVASLQKIKVIVSSRMGPPYLMARAPSYEGEVLVGNARYKGYSMDLISKIAEIIGFQFEFRLTEDGKYGNWDPNKKKWTGLIGDLLERKAHLAICDLTITHERREVADFSMPFMTLGISILHKRQDKKDINMFAFLDPFSVGVWIYTATLYLIMSVVLYFISRMTPGDWENPHPCEENPEELENIWDIKNCLWLTLGSIMTQGCDILPKGISSRMTVSMWWFFSLIMTSSYTANLAAFLTKANMEPTIDGAEALSKQTRVKYGLLESGSTESFFRNSNYSTYQRMWLNMQQFKPSVFERNNSDGVNRVQTTRNGLYAFLMESTQIEYVVATKCELKQVGSWLDTKSYGIAMPMNSPYRSAINKAILKLQESGELGELKKKWWLKERAPEKLCDSNSDDDEDGAELALANVGGVFLVLAIGVGIAFLLAVMEFLWNVRNVSVEEHMSYWEALKVEFKFACNIWITKKKTKPASSVSSGSSDGKSNKTDNKSIMHSILHSAAGSFANLNNVKT